jgi:hypothetical protein
MSYTLPEFLAHAVALEHEAAERYLELADMMESYRNDEVSSVFRDMVRFSQMHRDEIKARVGSIELPKLRSWQYRWSSPPEMGGVQAQVVATMPAPFSERQIMETLLRVPNVRVAFAKVLPLFFPPETLPQWTGKPNGVPIIVHPVSISM